MHPRARTEKITQVRIRTRINLLLQFIMAVYIFSGVKLWFELIGEENTMSVYRQVMNKY